MSDDMIILVCETPNCFDEEVPNTDLRAIAIRMLELEAGCPTCNRPISISVPNDTAEDDAPREFQDRNEIDLDPSWFLQFTPEDEVESFGTLVSRATAILVSAQSIADIAYDSDDGDKMIIHREAIERLEKDLQKYGDMIRDLEKREEIGTIGSDISKGARISSSFPKNEDAALRYSRKLLGGDSSSGTITNKGLLHKLGITKVDEETTQVLFGEEVGKDILEIKRPSESLEIIKVSKKNRFHEIKVPKYYSDDDSAKLAELISRNVEVERKLMHRTLGYLNNHGHKPPNLGELAEREIRLMEKGNEDATNYWMPLTITPRHREGGTTVQRKHVEDIDGKDEWDVMNRKVLSGMNVVIGRMRELRVIFAGRNGRRTEYFINDSEEGGKVGKNLLDKWDRMG